MLSLFRTNQAQASLILLLYALLLQLPALLGGAIPQPEISGDGYLGIWLMQLAAGRPWLSLLLPVGLLLVQNIQANLLSSRHLSSRKITQYSGLFLLLTWAIVPSFRWLSAYHAANIFLLFGLLSLGRLYKRQEPAVPLFNAGAWLGVAFLFRPEYLYYLPAFLIAIGVLRKPDLRSLLQFLTGFLLIVFFTGVGAYFFGFLSSFFQIQFGGLGLASFTAIPAYDLVPLALIGLFSLLAPVLYGGIVRLLNIEGKKGITILYWFLLFSIPLVLLGGPFVAAEAAALIVPAGIILGLYLVEIPPSRAEVVHLLLVTAAIIAACAAWLPLG